MRTDLLLVASAVMLAACSHSPPSNEPLGVSRTAIEIARASGADDPSVGEMTLAQDKLAQAEVAARANDKVKARRLSEQAAIDAQVARSRIAAEKSRKAAAEIDASLAALREEMTRSQP
ncbi:MAG TPA: DUF4398 domain-containing protein [Albitalea sp.]|uniref:DUF4398 domain-containing protein n=1 Tax=Piscinibacter sp. TaxID=1903157 RepID=UPI002ED2018B